MNGCVNHTIYHTRTIRDMINCIINDVISYMIHAMLLLIMGLMT